MTSTVLAGPEPVIERFTEPEPTRARLIWRGKFLIGGAALLVAAATFAISSMLPHSYEATSDVLIAGKSVEVSVDSVTGTNDLAAQYAQLAGTAAVLGAAAKATGVPLADLTRETRATTLANTNIVRIRAGAGSPDEARLRATAVAEALVARGTALAGDAGRTDATQIEALDKIVRDTKAEVARLTKAVRSAKPNSSAAAAANTSLDNAQAQVLQLTLKRVDLAVQARRDAGTRGVRLESLTATPVATRTAPLPPLYSVVGLIAGLVLATEVVVLSERRRSGAGRTRRGGRTA